jgi:prolyl-tRNA synthetase
MIFDEFEDKVKELLISIQKQMLEKATKHRDAMTHEVDTYEKFKEIMSTSRGFLKAFWCEDAACEKTIKEETKAATRCLPFSDNKGNVLEEQGVCVKCENPATHRWLFAQSY